MGKIIDLSGSRFGKIVAISPTSKRGADNSVIWECKCDCGKTAFVSSNNLRFNHTRSCGCLRGEHISSINRKSNKYERHGNYYIGYASNTGTPFFIDAEDYDLIKQYTWYENDNGYMLSPTAPKYQNRMHRMIMQCKSGDLIDHVNGHRWDNRKDNLRFANKQLNGINRGANCNNRTGIKGVSKHIDGKRYTARITIDGKTKYLGIFPSLESARDARIKAERDAFGEFAYTQW